MNKNQAREYLRSVAGQYLPRTARNYKFSAYTGETSVNAWGMSVDPQPQEGKVVEVTDDWVLIKKKGSEFFVAARDMLEAIPAVGATVLVTPYARRGFDGRRIDAPKEESRDGFRMQTFTIGVSESKLPLDVDALVCPELRDMIQQIEKLPADNVRTIAQVLIDAGAWQTAVTYQDPEPDDIIDKPPTLRFGIRSEKHQGFLEVRYDRGLDLYDVVLTGLEGQEVTKVDNVTGVDGQLAEVIVDLVDDGNWRLAKLEILKAAPKPKKLKAAA